MLPFFKNIRRQLARHLSTGADRSKVKSYLLYAVGEILLVVIGILIALQVNSWNEDRLQSKKEIRFLSEIRENLTADVNSIDSVIAFNITRDSLLRESMNGLISNHPDKEIARVIVKHLYHISEFNLFKQKRVAFENMTSSENIELISNDSLRINLTSYYQRGWELSEGTQARIMALTRTFVDEATPLILNKETIRILMKQDSPWPLTIALNREQKSQLLSLLYNLHDNLKFQNKTIQSFREEAQLLVFNITQFLKNH